MVIREVKFSHPYRFYIKESWGLHILKGLKQIWNQLYLRDHPVIEQRATGTKNNSQI